MFGGYLVIADLCIVSVDHCEALFGCLSGCGAVGRATFWFTGKTAGLLFCVCETLGTKGFALTSGIVGDSTNDLCTLLSADGLLIKGFFFAPEASNHRRRLEISSISPISLVHSLPCISATPTCVFFSSFSEAKARSARVAKLSSDVLSGCVAK